MCHSLVWGKFFVHTGQIIFFAMTACRPTLVALGLSGSTLIACLKERAGQWARKLCCTKRTLTCWARDDFRCRMVPNN